MDVFILAFVFGAVDAFFLAQLGAIVPMLVPDEHLPGAGLMQDRKELTELHGPGPGPGSLVAAVGSRVGLGIDAAACCRRTGPGVHQRRTAANGHPSSTSRVC